jgi:hypothetical protein
VRIRRDGDLTTEIIEATLPALVSVTDQINDPRYPSFKGIMAAKKKPSRTLTLADLGIPASDVGLSAAWTAVPRCASPTSTTSEQRDDFVLQLCLTVVSLVRGRRVLLDGWSRLVHLDDAAVEVDRAQPPRLGVAVLARLVADLPASRFSPRVPRRSAARQPVQSAPPGVSGKGPSLCTGQPMIAEQDRPSG